MPRRKKTAPAAMIGALEGADWALAKIAEEEGLAGRLGVELEGRVAALREDYAARIRPALERARMLRDAVRAFAEDHPHLFAGAERSVKLVHGRIGYRRTPPSIRLLAKAETVVAALKARGLLDAVITKEAPNKDVLAAYPDEILKEVRAKREQKDEFYIALRDEEAAERAAAGAS